MDLAAVGRRVAARRDLERVAAGVWLLRGGIPREMNVHLLEDDGGGVTLFDAGIQMMAGALQEVAEPLGGINRIVLGHADADHRGGAAGIDAPVFCHPAEQPAAESAQSLRPYHRLDRMAPHAHAAYKRLLPLWDGGAVTVTGTVGEGDDISGFRVIHLPGHAPGLIALLREHDGLALTSDAFYTLDPQTVLHGPPKVPHPAFNEDGWRARESLRKLADIGPSAAWPGHARAVTEDVPAQLRRAAADY